MDVDTVTIGFVVLPLAFVNVTVSVPKLSTAICFVKTPLAFVLRSVWPDLNSWPVSLAVKKIPSVDGSIFKYQLFNKGQAVATRHFFKPGEKWVVIKIKFVALIVRTSVLGLSILLGVRGRLAIG